MVSSSTCAPSFPRVPAVRSSPAGTWLRPREVSPPNDKTSGRVPSRTVARRPARPRTVRAAVCRPASAQSYRSARSQTVPHRHAPSTPSPSFPRTLLPADSRPVRRNGRMPERRPPPGPASSPGRPTDPPGGGPRRVHRTRRCGHPVAERPRHVVRRTVVDQRKTAREGLSVPAPDAGVAHGGGRRPGGDRRGAFGAGRSAGSSRTPVRRSGR